jgi:hypothetical protein
MATSCFSVVLGNERRSNVGVSVPMWQITPNNALQPTSFLCRRKLNLRPAQN